MKKFFSITTEWKNKKCYKKKENYDKFFVQNLIDKLPPKQIYFTFSNLE